jgi:hypothetical protein
MAGSVGRALILLGSVAGASAASPAAELACSLNGILVGGKCKCDAPWKGANCAKLDILPKEKGSLPAYGFAPNVTSWGGNVIKNDAGSYDMWVSEMVGKNCGLKTWGTDPSTNNSLNHTTRMNLVLKLQFCLLINGNVAWNR